MDLSALPAAIAGLLVGAIGRGPSCPACPKCPDLSCENIVWAPAILCGIGCLSLGYMIGKWESAQRQPVEELQPLADADRTELAHRQLEDIRRRRLV